MTLGCAGAAAPAFDVEVVLRASWAPLPLRSFTRALISLAAARVRCRAVGLAFPLLLLLLLPLPLLVGGASSLSCDCVVENWRK
jgi:hypothetical protein